MDELQIISGMLTVVADGKGRLYSSVKGSRAAVLIVWEILTDAILGDDQSQCGADMLKSFIESCSSSEERKHMITSLYAVLWQARGGIASSLTCWRKPLEVCADGLEW